MWFPRPDDEGHVILLEPSGTWSARDVFALIVDPTATEWRHKVGVGGASDGSAKTTTRLLASRGWVLKTRTDLTFSTAGDARAWLLEARARGRAASVWHPDKLWSLLGVDGAWLPLTICPELTTLRNLETLRERRAAWTRMIQAAIDAHRLHGLGLDLNPANFATGPGGASERLYYLDEELYDRLETRNVAGAIVARIPEERAATTDDWLHWGHELRATLVGGNFRWDELVGEVREYPLAARLEERRAALVDGLGAPRAAVVAAPRAEITCIFADVHANLSALTAVLDAAREQGATDFLFLGDAVGYGPEPAECIRRIAELPRSIAIRGNHDHAIATGNLDVGMNSLAKECAAWTRTVLSEAELSWLARLPIEHMEPDWCAVHGAPRDPRRFLAYVYELTYEDNLRYLKEQRMPLCFHGHTHVQLAHVEAALGASKLPGERTLELSPRQTWLVNPGSVGQPRDGDPRAAFALWNRRTGEVTTRRVAYDIDVTARALRAAHLPARLEERLRGGS